MTAAFEDPSSPGRRRLLEVAAAARVPGRTEVVGLLTGPGATSLKVPGGGSVSADYLAQRGFEGKAGQSVVLSSAAAPDGPGPVVIALGIGTGPDRPASEGIRLAAAGLVRSAGRARSVALVMGALPEGLAASEAAQVAAEGAALATYRYLGFKSSSEGGSQVERLTVVSNSAAQLLPALERGSAIASAVALVRDLVNEPPGSLTPTRMAAISELVAESHGIKAKVFDLADIQRERLGGLAGVARGSEQEPRMVRLEYRPSAPVRATVALVGKGITFDSGGLSLKSGDGMMTMKNDMAGAAVVLGTMSVLAELDVPVRVVGFMPMTENMPGGRAIKPGDVLRARNGKTMEVLNTDAEGRLVLADGLSLAAEEKPDAIIDLATLTGAVVVALGRKIAGLMGNDEALVARVQSAGAGAAERYWPLPLPAEYRRDIDSQVADMKNIGNPSQAGSIIAGLFLQEFVDDRPWAHLDIAGTAFGDTDEGYTSRGATGFGLRTLVELLSNWSSAASPPAGATKSAGRKATKAGTAGKATEAGTAGKRS
ncbi:MAG: leucyl aminopeptidase [Acidimicrobiales bacterium]